MLGQTRQWQTHHRKICKRYNRYTASTQYQALDPRERTDALLLSQFLIQAFSTEDYTRRASDDADDLATFFNLLKQPYTGLKTPPLCRPTVDSRVSEAADDIYARFSNNNFVLHSHLTSYAHGVFPLASRLFNHSCYPNCVTKYVIDPTNVVTMEVVAIRHIAQGEEVRVNP